MASAYHLSALNPAVFEHLVGALALRVLGAGVSTFGPGPDGGRDGLFVGEAPYPSSDERWSGTWYLQAKFHAPKVSGDEQKWLLRQIQGELEAFADEDSKRQWPDIWILATNVDPSAVAETGTHDKALALVREARPELAERFHIWGGSKIVELLGRLEDVAKRYGHFLTPGHVLSALFEWLQDERASVDRVLEYLVTEAIEDSKYAKLEQAGSAADSRPGIHRLFVDVPFRAGGRSWDSKALETLSFAAAENHQMGGVVLAREAWASYRRDPRRARVWVVRGGPGQGKSTLGQCFCQIQRAALILGAEDDELLVAPETRQLAEEVREDARKHGESVWPLAPRIPIYFELKDYAAWLGRRDQDDPPGILAYLATRIRRRIGSEVAVATLERALATRSWAVVFDGLDEVPSGIKDWVAQEIAMFLRRTAPRSDLFALCTSRPQGYTGQFDSLGGAAIQLTALSVDEALLCAEPLIRLQRSKEEGDQGLTILKEAVDSPAVLSLMKTPLQAHIMAVIVRAGQRPPKMRWRLYDRFYSVIFNRERDKSHTDPRLRKIFEEDEELLTRVHDHAGFALHALAETAEGSESALDREEFEKLVRRLVEQHKDTDHDEIVDSLMQAAKERLVLLTTPETSGQIRYDVRQLQEFFAARFLFHDVDLDTLRERLKIVAGDSHWREVMHFLMSALVEGKRRNELGVAIEVLTWLDQGEGDEATARFCTRLARGGHIAARLLEDGVLEASKSDRQRFRELLRSCLTVDDPAFLEQHSNIEGPASRAWVWELLSEHVATRQLGEALGALCLLWKLLDDEQQAQQLFLRQLPKLSRSVLRWCEQDLSRPWHVECLHKIFSSEALGPTPDTPSAGLNRSLLEFLNAHGDPPYRDELLLLTWWRETFILLRGEEPLNRRWVQLNPWIRPGENSHWRLQAQHPRRFKGVLGKVQNALMLEFYPSNESLRQFLDSHPEGTKIRYGGRALAGRLQELDLGEIDDALRKATPEAVEDSIPRGEVLPGIPIPTTITRILERPTIEQFEDLAQDNPVNAIVIWDGSLNDSIGEDPRALEVICRAIRQDPSRARWVSPLNWHHLIDHDRSIKDLLVDGYTIQFLDLGRLKWDFFLRSTTRAFQLDLPRDQRVLLPLGTHLIALSHSESRVLARGYVANPEDLVTLIEDPSTDPSARLGTLLVALVHPEGGSPFFAKYGQTLHDLPADLAESIAVVVWGVDQQLGWRKPEVRRALSALISARPIEASSETRWIDLYRNCREHSRAPVTQTGCRDAWLAYES